MMRFDISMQATHRGQFETDAGLYFAASTNSANVTVKLKNIQ